MRKLGFCFLFLSSIFGISSCSDENSGVSAGGGGFSSENSGVDFVDFRNAVEARAGNGAMECGIANSDQCIADSFQAAVAAYSVIGENGIESQGGAGVAVTSNSKVYFLTFDSDPSDDGSFTNGRIITRECVNPQLSGPSMGSFACELLQAEN